MPSYPSQYVTTTFQEEQLGYSSIFRCVEPLTPFLLAWVALVKCRSSISSTACNSTSENVELACLEIFSLHWRQRCSALDLRIHEWSSLGICSLIKDVMVQKIMIQNKNLMRPSKSAAKIAEWPVGSSSMTLSKNMLLAVADSEKFAWALPGFILREKSTLFR